MEKCNFLKILQCPDFENLWGDSWHLFQPKKLDESDGGFCFLRIIFSSHVLPPLKNPSGYKLINKAKMVWYGMEGGEGVAKWLWGSHRTQRPPRRIQISAAQKNAKTLRGSKRTGTQQQHWMVGMHQTNRKVPDQTSIQNPTMGIKIT